MFNKKSFCFLLFSFFFATSGYAVNGDLRFGYFGKERGDDGEFRLRARIGYGIQLNETWSAKARIAGRYSNSNKNNFNVEFFTSIPSTDGLRLGDTTIDELYVQTKFGKNQIRIGRQQTKTELVGVAKKSLDRNTSPNTDITWTDGIYWKRQHDNGWIGHAIVQYNTNQGSTEVRRTPLDFSDSGSRLSTMIAFDKTSKKDFWAQRGVNISYLPKSLHTSGVNAGRIDDYWTITGKLASQWSLANSEKIILAGELGYAPNTPNNSVFNLGATGSTKGTAWQSSINYFNFLPKHSIGLLVAQAEAGWLLSPDFRSNNTLVEVRYLVKFSKILKLEIRSRRRKEIEQPTTSTEKKLNKDFYIRLTWKF